MVSPSHGCDPYHTKDISEVSSNPQWSSVLPEPSTSVPRQQTRPDSTPSIESKTTSIPRFNTERFWRSKDLSEEHFRQDDPDPDSPYANTISNRVRKRSQVPSAEEQLSAKLGTTFIHSPLSRAEVTSRNPTPNSRRGSNGHLWSNPAPFQERSTTIKDFGASPGDPSIQRPESTYMPRDQRSRRGTMASIVHHIVPQSIARTFTNGTLYNRARRGTIWSTYKKAQARGAQLQRNRWVQILFEYSVYISLLSFLYFVLVGQPLWKGLVWWLYWVMKHKFVLRGGYGITLGLAFFYAFTPLLNCFEKDPPPAQNTFGTDGLLQEGTRDTALLIPCHKSADILPATLEAALNIFPASHIFVLANGNSKEPLDNTEGVCRPYGVNYLWCPIGSKIVAQFVGCYAASDFTNVLLIDDDCVLPKNFPVVTDRLKGNVKCIGYTIKSVGSKGSKGTLCQQAQDLEYKLSGLQRMFAGIIGSVNFPHGAIALWNRSLLLKSFNEHPGYHVSEDWFFGHVARKLGCRIVMCSQVFVSTETPSSVFLSNGSRGGFGEMTVFKQRFKRWNFFLINGLYYNMAYILCCWKLGFRELGTKIFVFKEVYETLLYLIAPFVLPISFIIRPTFSAILLGATTGMYFLNTIIFNEIHLRHKRERVGWTALYVYFVPYKIVLTGIDVLSCYWSLLKYARYFAKRHLKVTEDEKAVEIILRLEEDREATDSRIGAPGRRMTVHTICTSSTSENSDKDSLDTLSCIRTKGIAAVDYAMVRIESSTC